MIVNFGFGKCPFCGDFGKEVQQKIFHCRRCEVAFDEFFVSFGQKENIEEKFWN